MSMNMKDVWVAQERHRAYRRLAEGRQVFPGRSKTAFSPNMADRMSGLQTRMQNWLAILNAGRRQHLPGRTPATEV